MTIVAPTDSGKSYLIRNMLDNGLAEGYNSIDRSFYNDKTWDDLLPTRYNEIHVFSPSMKYNGEYNRYKPEAEEHGFSTSEILPLQVRNKFVFHEKCLREELDTIIDNQEQQVELVNEYIRRGRTDVKLPRVLIIMDDCLDTTAFSRPGAMNHLASAGRHIGIDVIIVSQHLNRISKTTRINSRYFILFSPFSVLEAESFINQYIPRERRRHAHKLIYDIWAVQYQFVYINCTEYDATKRLHSSKAGVFPDFITQINMLELDYNKN